MHTNGESLPSRNVAFRWTPTISHYVLGHGNAPALGARICGRASLREANSRSSAVMERSLQPLTTEQLMAAYVGGDANAFDELYRRMSPKIFGYLLRLTRNKERAEDLLQTTFSKIHRARSSYLDGAPFLPWALAIARRSFYDEVRSAKHRKEDLSADGMLPDNIAANTGLSNEMTSTLEKAMWSLPTNYREAIQLTKVTGLSMAEAASISGTTATAMKLRVHRGYKALREKLEEFRDDLS